VTPPVDVVVEKVGHVDTAQTATAAEEEEDVVGVGVVVDAVVEREDGNHLVVVVAVVACYYSMASPALDLVPVPGIAVGIVLVA
jgi:hypothetical protein